MKKFFISFVLIISLLFNVFADNKQAHKELREVFENYGLLPELIEKGFSLDKLDEIDDPIEMRDYLQPFFMDENGMPLDNHANINFKSLNGKGVGFVKTFSYMHIDWSDEYGSKDELLKKGYKEDEIFYYPYFNGEWKDGYRVGKKYMGGLLSDEFFNEPFIVENENTLYCGLCSFYEENNTYYNTIKSSKKKYLVLDISGNSGGFDASYRKLVDAIKKMKPKKVFLLINHSTFSMGDYCAFYLKKDLSNIDTVLIGTPTEGGVSACKGKEHKISFDDFTVNTSLGPATYGEYHLMQEGIGATPDIYSSSHEESMEIVKKLTGDNVKSPKEIFVYDYF